MREFIKKRFADVITTPILWVWYAAGWRGEGELPRDINKYILVAAPHTTNWDYVNMIALSARYRRLPHTLVKSEVFDWCLIGRFVKWIGGIPIDRKKEQNIVDQVADFIRAKERIVLVIAPEGTRKKTDHWKSGFYYMALKAEVPIVLGFLDYRRKRGGGGKIVYPSGDIERDMEIIRQYYQQYGCGKFPDQASDVKIQGESDHVKDAP